MTPERRTHEYIVVVLDTHGDILTRATWLSHSTAFADADNMTAMTRAQFETRKLYPSLGDGLYVKTLCVLKDGKELGTVTYHKSVIDMKPEPFSKEIMAGAEGYPEPAYEDDDDDDDDIDDDDDMNSDYFDLD
jgi:hypothetical protein